VATQAQYTREQAMRLYQVPDAFIRSRTTVKNDPRVLHESLSTVVQQTTPTGLLCLEIRCFALALRRTIRDQEITLDHLVEILKQGAFEETEKLEPGTKERTMTGMKLTKDLGLVEDGNNASGAIDQNKQPAGTTTL
jgi:hypothetical protein